MSTVAMADNPASQAQDDNSLKELTGTNSNKPNVTSAPPATITRVGTGSSWPIDSASSAPCPQPPDDEQDQKRHLASPNSGVDGWHSPARQHQRSAVPHQIIKETIDVHTAYTKVGQYGVSQLRINQYCIIKEIGRGSFGSVHSAVDQYGCEFAIKEMSKSRLRRQMQTIVMRQRSGIVPNNESFKKSLSQLDDSEDPLALIRLEVAIMKKLHHPNLVALYEVLDDPGDDSLYMVLEMCHKGPVMKIDVCQSLPPLDNETAWLRFRDLLLGIEYLHYQHICHRDIKPDNLLITSDDVLKIVDFGVSEMHSKATELRTTAYVGSPAFMPPELCEKHRDISGAAVDIWSMGITLCCFKYGRLPFNHDDPLKMYEAICHDDPFIPEDEDPQLRHLIGRLLDKDPNKRIKMPELREHPWITKGGRDPLLSAEENCAEPIEMPTKLDVRRAISKRINNAFFVGKAISKFRKITSNNKKRREASQLSHETENDGNVHEHAIELVKERLSFRAMKTMDLKTPKAALYPKKSEQRRGPGDQQIILLGIGGGTHDTRYTDEPEATNFVSDSPTGCDFNIYDRAFEEQLQRIEKRTEAKGVQVPVYLTRFVQAKSVPLLVGGNPKMGVVAEQEAQQK